MEQINVYRYYFVIYAFLIKARITVCEFHIQWV